MIEINRDIVKTSYLIDINFLFDQNLSSLENINLTESKVPVLHI